MVSWRVGILLTGLTTPVGWLSFTPTDHPKSVRNRCVIEVFGGVFVLSHCSFDFSVGVGAFVVGLSQIFFFSWTQRVVGKGYQTVHITFEIQFKISSYFIIDDLFENFMMTLHISLIKIIGADLVFENVNTSELLSEFDAWWIITIHVKMRYWLRIKDAYPADKNV